MSLLPSQFPRLAVHVEMAFGADLTASEASWVWTDVTHRTTPGSRTRLLDAPITIKRGRTDQSSAVQPMAASVVLDNPDGALTPDNPMSPWYPNVKLGTPCRISADVGEPHLTLTGAVGSRARTPDHPDLDITSDWTIIVELVPPMRLPPSGVSYEIVGKFNLAGNQRSVLLFLSADGRLRLRWSTDGTAGGELDAVAPVSVTLSDSGPLTVAAWLRVNNGAGGRTTTFYQCPGHLADFLADPDAFVLGADTDPGTTSVFSSTATLDIGDPGSGFSPYPGQVNRLQIRAGDPFTGPVRANPDFTTAQPGDTILVDSTGKTWTVNAPASITNRRVRMVGEVVEVAPVWPHGDLSGPDPASLPGDSQVTVGVAGMLRRMNQGQKPLNSALFRAVTAPINAAAVKAYWPMEDERGATSAASPIAGVSPMIVGGQLAFASSSDLDASKPLPTIAAGAPGGWNARVPPFATTSWSLDWFLHLPTPVTAPANTPLNVVTSTGRVNQWLIQANSANVTVSGIDVNGVGVVLSTFPWAPDFFVFPSLLRLQVVQNGGNVDWALNWVPIYGAGAGFVFGVNGSYAGTAGAPTNVANLISTGPPDGITVGHMIVADNRVLGWLAPADSAYVGEPAASRIARLCREHNIPVIVDGPHDSGTTTGWPAALLAGATAMGPQRALTLPELLNECAEADMGILAEQQVSRGLLYRARTSLYNQPTKLVFDAKAVHGGDIVNPYEPVLDDRARVNDITVARDRGSSARAVDYDPATDELYDTEITLNVRSDGQLTDQAWWRLRQLDWPGMRAASVTSELSVTSDHGAGWLDVGLGDRVQVVNLPPQHPPGPVDMLVQGSSEELSPGRWTPTFNSTPAGPWEVGVRDDPDRSRRDSGTSTLAASFAAGASTSMSVAVASGLLWTTAPANFPFDLDVGGARITVTGISGAASPQTFTVSTTVVNGVTKTIPAGTAVRLWRPTVRAL